MDQALGRLCQHPKRIVFVDGMHERAIAAAAECARRHWGVGILLGNVEAVRQAAWEADCALDKVLVVDPERASDRELFSQRLTELPPFRGTTPEEALRIVSQPAHFGAMMLASGAADALVGGLSENSGSFLRPLFQIIRPLPGVKTIAGAAVVELPGREPLVLADCGIVPSPTPEQLAYIAIESARLARQLSGTPPRVAFLSYATYQEAQTGSAPKLEEALNLTRAGLEKLGVEAAVDGPLQADVALSPEAAAVKAPNSAVAGQANVLIFPDLASGNISLKLLQRLAGGRVYGQIMLGLEKPAVDVARTADVEEILNAAGLAALQAIAYRELYPANL